MVSGIAENDSLAGAVLDCGFHESRRQLDYKTPMRGGRMTIADRFFLATLSPARKGARNCTLSDGSATNAAPSTTVTATPQSTSGS